MMGNTAEIAIECNILFTICSLFTGALTFLFSGTSPIKLFKTGIYCRDVRREKKHLQGQFAMKCQEIAHN